MKGKTALILAEGDLLSSALKERLPAQCLAIAVDGGLKQAVPLELMPQWVVGDLDSIEPSLLQHYVRLGTVVEQHPTEKDYTDLELALQLAQREGCTKAIILGGFGGEVDHFFCNGLLLASENYGSLEIEWWSDAYRVVSVRSQATFFGKSGDKLSLLALGGVASGIVSSGLKWPYEGSGLQPFSSHGLRNEFLSIEVSLSVKQGCLLAFHHW